MSGFEAPIRFMPDAKIVEVTNKLGALIDANKASFGEDFNVFVALGIIFFMKLRRNVPPAAQIAVVSLLAQKSEQMEPESGDEPSA